MSARQNKKQRKGRNNANNRERTVTTLTEDPNTPFLVPTSSEEPAGANLMSSPFSVASSSAGNPNNVPQAAYQIPGSFGFGYNNFVGPMHGTVHPQHQPQQQPFYSSQPQQQPILPSGKNDLEILEKLKEMIKNGQHEAYKAIPQPAALASIYLGPHSQSQVPHHPEQGPDFHHSNVDGPSQGNQPQGSGPSSPADLGRRPPRIQSKDGWDPSGTRKPAGALSGGGAQPINNSNQSSHGGRYNQNAPSTINTNIHGNGKPNSTGPPSAGIKSSTDVHMSDANPSPLTTSTTGGPEPPSPSQRSARFEGTNTRLSGTNSSGNLDQNRPPNDRPGLGESPYGGSRPNDMSPDKSSTFDGKDTRESGWSIRDGPTPLDDRRRDPDRPPSPSSRSLNGGPDARPGLDNRGPPGPPRDDRFYDRDRERDRDRDRRDWDHRDRDRRPFDRFRDTRMTDARRPPPEQRHYEPDYDRQPIPRRYDARGPDEPPADSRRPPDVRAPPTPTSIDDRGGRPPLDDRLPPARVPPGDLRASIDSRSSHDSRAPLPDSRVPPPDNRPVRGATFDDRIVKPSTADDHRGPPPTDDRAVRSSAPVRPADASGVRPGDDRGVHAPPPPSAEDRTARPQVPLEERLGRPSLQDRLSQPPSARPETSHLSRQASLEERLSHPSGDLSGRPISVPDDRTVRPVVPERDRVGLRPGPPDERNGRGPPPIQDDRARLDDRPGRPADRYAPPPTPTSDTRSVGYSAPPIARDDPRVAKPPSPPHRPASRDYRPPGRPISRERSEIRTSTYRPDERSYPDERRLDPMDVDAPPRYTDNRVPYNRPFSPPSAADLARDRARAQFPPSPPRSSVTSTDPVPYDSSGRDWQYSQYNDRRRDWSAAEEESYWKSRPQWDRNNPPSDRERFERDVPPPPPRNHGWDARDDRDRRDNFTRPASPRGFDGPPRPLSSRLTDNYSGPPPSSAPPVDRTYPPRDAPPFNRVRQRSPSPVRRPGPGPIDDPRPPMKRSRDDVYPTGYYSPQGRDPPLRRPTDYPSRGGSPPPPSSGSSYYERGPPPSSSGTSTSVAGDRDYPGPPGRDNYPPPGAYDRPRSPGPPRGGGYTRGGYTRAGDARDDRRYPPPPMAPPPRRP